MLYRCVNASGCALRITYRMRASVSIRHWQHVAPLNMNYSRNVYAMWASMQYVQWKQTSWLYIGFVSTHRSMLSRSCDSSKCCTDYVEDRFRSLTTSWCWGTITFICYRLPRKLVQSWSIHVKPHLELWQTVQNLLNSCSRPHVA